MATKCPICEKEDVKVIRDNKTGEVIKVQCKSYNVVRNGDEYENVGDCNFVLWLKQEKSFGKNLTTDEVKKLIAGETIKNKAGDKMVLDKTGGDTGRYFTRIERAEAEDL